MAGAGAVPFVQAKIKQRKVMLFAKKGSPECNRARKILSEYGLPGEIYEVCEIERRQDCTQIENYFQIICLTDTRSVPQLFVAGKYIGGEEEIPRLHESGKLRTILAALNESNNTDQQSQEETGGQNQEE